MNWKERILEFWEKGIVHTIVVEGNIFDYQMVEGKKKPVEEVLIEMPFDVVIFYNLARGLQILKGKEREVLSFLSRGPQVDIFVPGREESFIPLPKVPAEVFPALDRLLHANLKKKILLVFEYGESLFREEMGGNLNEEWKIYLLNWARDGIISQNKHLIIVLTKFSADLDPRILDSDRGIKVVTLSKPQEEERRKFVESLDFSLKEGVNLEEVVNLSAGLSLSQIEEFLALFDPPDLKFLKRYKEEILNQEYQGLIEIIQPAFGFEAIGGLTEIKKELKKILKAIRTGNWKRVPMGILFVGPPGTGKSAMAEALAKEASFNFIRLGLIFEKWVGSSERNLRKALMAIRMLTPVVVFVDEIDQLLGKREEVSTDSGVQRRFLGEILSFMGDTSLRGKVLWIGATNRPDLIEKAMLRPGRFDLKLPFLPPQTTQERIAIFKALLRKYKIKAKIEEKDLEKLFKPLKGYTGADIEAILLSAFSHAQDKDREIIQKTDLEFAISDYIPYFDPKVEEMIKLAIRVTSSRRFLPRDISLSV